MLYLLGCSSTQFQCSSGQCVSSSFNAMEGLEDLEVFQWKWWEELQYVSYSFRQYQLLCVDCYWQLATNCYNLYSISKLEFSDAAMVSVSAPLIPACDGNLDCTDSSDEAGCSKLPKYFWWGAWGLEIHTMDLIAVSCARKPRTLWYHNHYHCQLLQV